MGAANRACSGVSGVPRGARGGRVPGKERGHRAEGPRAGPVRGPGYRESRWGWEGAWGSHPEHPPAGGGWSVGTTSMGTSCWRVPEHPHPPGPLSAPDSLGKGGEPSRAMAAVGEPVPVSPRRSLSPSHSLPDPRGGKGPSRCSPTLPTSPPSLIPLQERCRQQGHRQRGNPALHLSLSENSPPNHP